MKFRALLAALVFLTGSAHAATFQPTVNPLLPVQNSPLASFPVRNNFQATYNDLISVAGLIPGGGGSSGTVTTISCSATSPVVCSVNNPTTTPTINLSISLGTNSAPGALQCDNSTTTCSGGIISAVTGGIGTVTTTGSPASGNLSFFSGATSITSGNLSGDITTSGTGATTLATVNSNVGSFGSSTSIPTLTVNGKGLVTAATGNVVIAPAGTLSGTTLNSTVVTSSLTSVGTLGSLTITGALVANGLTYPSSLTSGGVLYASSSSVIASSGALTASLPVFGGGAGAAPVSGTRSGNTTQVATSTGSHTSGNEASWDANGNVIDAGVSQVNQGIRAISFVIDGGGSTISTGVKGFLLVPFACTINSVTMLGDQSGSIVVDIWKKAFTTTLPAVGNTITASALPTITTAITSQDTTLTGWTTAVSANDMIGFNVNSVTTMQRVTVILKCTAT